MSAGAWERKDADPTGTEGSNCRGGLVTTAKGAFEGAPAERGGPYTMLAPILETESDAVDVADVDDDVDDDDDDDVGCRISAVTLCEEKV